MKNFNKAMLARSMATLFFVASLGHSVIAKAADRELMMLPTEREIEIALGAGPAHMRAEATVYVFGAQGYKKVRTGTNGVTCLVNRDGQQAGGAVLRPTCWDAEGSASILPVALRVGALLAQGRSAGEISTEVDAAYQSGQFFSPRKAGIAYMLRGDIVYEPASDSIKTLFPPHYMVYAPGVTNADIGLTDAAQNQPNTLPFIYAGYSGGSRTAYLIVLATPAVAK